MERAGRGGAEGFRPDLEGLRGVAILLVLLFHAGVPGTNGGFVGVDVFFVLSGFLITGLLLRERERAGRIDLLAFYARRARRILPAALVVLVATLGVSAVVLGPLELERAAGDALACALFVGNLRFAANTMDYFAAAQTPSPFLHYWSLGVEEQFYLLWPALLIVATRFGRPRLGAGLLLTALTAASLVTAIVLTSIAGAWAFYSLPARAWQLGIGGLLAVTAAWQGRLPDRLVAILGWAGLAAIIASLVVIGDSTPYPGVAALLPSLGAAGVVLSGARPWSPGAVLVVAPLRFLGRISYSLYLVHWPLLVLPAVGLPIGETLPLAERLGLAGLAILLAAASYRWVEEPIHRGRRLVLPARPTLAAAGAAVAVAVLVAVGIGSDATSTLAAYSSSSLPASAPGAGGADDGPLPSIAPSSSAVSTPSTDLETPIPSLGSPSPPSSSTPGPSSTAPSSSPGPVLGLGGPAPTPPPGPGPAGPQPLPRSVRPSLAAASTDWEALVPDGCTLGDAGSAARSCTFGDPHSSRVVALVGDSHAAQWFPALDRLAKLNDWRLVTFTKISCRFFDLPIYSRVMKREYTECEAWRPNVVAALKALQPGLVVVSVAGGMQPMVPADDDPTRQGVAVARLLAGVPGAKAIVVDTPQSIYDVPSCLADHLGDTRPCRTSRAVALSWRHLKLERAAVANLRSAALVDLTNAICPSDPCPVVLGGMIVYRDSFHLTATFDATLAASLARALPDPWAAADAPVAAAPSAGLAAVPVSSMPPATEPQASEDVPTEVALTRSIAV